MGIEVGACRLNDGCRFSLGDLGFGKKLGGHDCAFWSKRFSHLGFFPQPLGRFLGHVAFIEEIGCMLEDHASLLHLFNMDISDGQKVTISLDISVGCVSVPVVGEWGLVHSELLEMFLKRSKGGIKVQGERTHTLRVRNGYEIEGDDHVTAFSIQRDAIRLFQFLYTIRYFCILCKRSQDKRDYYKFDRIKYIQC